jgi:hypothetical protein
VSADGRAGLSASEDRTLIVWDLAHGEARRRLALDAKPFGCALSADGRLALVGDAKGDVTCFEIVLP